MKKNYSPFAIIRSALSLSVILAGTVVIPVYAEYNQDYYISNNIEFFNPDDSVQCSPSTGGQNGSTNTASNGNKDYAGNQIIKDDQLEKIKNNRAVYEEASKETKIPWQVFAVIHIRESNLADYNPPNDDGSQGIYQDYGWKYNNGRPYVTGTVTRDEFLRQTINAGKHMQEKIATNSFGYSADLIEKGDPDALKQLFFYYNGATSGYTDQANALGFDKGFEGSPYVMNRADLKRDPTVEPTKTNNTWGQVWSDGGSIEYPARSDYGAFVMYAALADIPTTGGTVGCVGKSLGAGANGWATSAMTIYYQNKDPWATKQYGFTANDTIKACGCGPTSMSMAVATLNNDPNVTPESMSNFFSSNNYINAASGCGTQFTGDFKSVGDEYGLNITPIQTDLSAAETAVKRGSFVLMSFHAGSAFGNCCGHIMLMRGVTDSGNYLFADPSEYADPYSDTLDSEYLSNKTLKDEGYPASDFKDGIQAMWEIRKG